LGRVGENGLLLIGSSGCRLSGVGVVRVRQS
jgi:hypothetical protein